MARSSIGFSAAKVARLIDDARQGSAAATGQLLDACRAYLLLVANRQLDPQLRAKVGASDLVQETCVNAHRGMARFRGGSERELLTWLSRILHNVLAEARRRHRDEDSLPGMASSHEGASWLASPQATPRRQLLEHEERQQMSQALARLPAHYLEIIELRNQQQLGFAEIGERIGLGEDGARKRWGQAVRQLRIELNGYADEAPS